MQRNYWPAVFFVGVLLFLSSCSKFTTDPCGSFIEVQEEVSQRTGHTISWQRQEEDSCEVKEWLEQTLQRELTVDDAVQVALLNNQRLKARYENLGIAQAQLVQAGLFQNPIFSMSLKYEKFIDSAHIIEMGLVQNFLDILLKPMKTRLAGAELEAIKSEVAAHVLDIIAETKIAYYMLQASEQALLMRQQVLQATEASYDVAKRLHKAGNVTSLALTMERSNYEQMKIDVSQAEVEVMEAREKLNVLMGMWGMNIHWKLSEELLEIPKQQMDVTSIESQVIASSLDLQGSRQRMRVTALSLGVEASEIMFPEMTIGVDTEREPAKIWFGGPHLSIGIPIFDIGLAKKAAACAELSKQWHEYTALAIEIRAAARSASFRLLNAFKQHRYFQEVIVPLEEQITEGTLLRLNAMQLGVFDLLVIKQKEIETKLRAITSYRDYWIARTEVEMLASGRMSQKNHTGGAP